MCRTLKGLQDVACALRRKLEQKGLALEEVDRRLDWPPGRLQGLLAGDEGLRIDQLQEVLAVASIEEHAFFADLYDLTPNAAKSVHEELPYSTGALSDEDAVDFPPSHEVLGLFRMLVQEGVRENPREDSTGTVTGDNFPEDRPPRPRKNRRF